MKFGVFSVSMPEYTPEETLKTLKELGYDGVEWRVTNIPKEAPQVPYEVRYWGDNKSTIEIDTIEEQAAELKAQADKYGIEIFSLTTYLKPADLEKAESVMKAAASIGVPKMRIFQDGYNSTETQTDYKIMMNEIRANVCRLEALAKKYKVKVLLELHMDTLLASPSSAYNLLAGFDPEYIGVIFDPGNMVNEGFENYQKSFELLGAYIGHVHVKNCILKEDGRDEFGSRKWKREQAELWDGMADLRELFRVMKKYGYDGTVSVEDFSNGKPTYEKLKANIEYVKKLAASV